MDKTTIRKKVASRLASNTPAERNKETAIFGFGKKNAPQPSDQRTPTTQQEKITNENQIDYSVLGIKPDKVNYELRIEMLRVLKTLNRRGRLFNIRKITNVSPEVVCAVAEIRGNSSLSALKSDIENCGFGNVFQGISTNTKRPVIAYGENDNFVLSVDTHMNIITLVSK